MSEKEEKKVYSVSDIQRMLGMGRNNVYKFLENAYKTQSPFRVLKLGKIYKIPKNSFDNWLNGYLIS